jgi:hypothetical protein
MNTSPPLPFIGEPVAIPSRTLAILREDIAPKVPTPEPERFDWGPDNSDIAVPEQPAIAIYVNAWDMIVVRQEGRGRDDDFVTIAAHNAARVARGILEAAGFQGVGLYSSKGGGGRIDINDGDTPETLGAE